VNISVDSRGDSYDNALADVEYATLEWLDWFNHRRLLEPDGNVPPAEFEAAYSRKEDTSIIEQLEEPSLR